MGRRGLQSEDPSAARLLSGRLPDAAGFAVRRGRGFCGRLGAAVRGLGRNRGRKNRRLNASERVGGKGSFVKFFHSRVRSKGVIL